MEGRDPSSLPSDLVADLQSGKLGTEALKAFLALGASPLNRPFLAIKPLRRRMMADATFLEKCVIDIAVGATAQFFAEMQQRGDNFRREADFVLAGMVTVVLANFASVYSAAPSIGMAASTAKGFFATCPDNMFQVVQQGAAPFSVRQRLGAVVKPMPQLFLVGFFAAAGGYAYAAASVAYRKWRNPGKADNAVRPAAAAAPPPPPRPARGSARLASGLRRQTLHLRSLVRRRGSRGARLLLAWCRGCWTRRRSARSRWRSAPTWPSTPISATRPAPAPCPTRPGAVARWR